MRILVVSAFAPCPPDWGAAVRVYQLLRHLSTEHRVTLLAYGEPSTASSLAYKDVCQEVHLVSHGDGSGRSRRIGQLRSLASPEPFHALRLRTSAFQAALDQLLSDNVFDVVQVESSPMMCLRYSARVPIVIDEHNLESELLQRQAETETSLLRRRFNAREARKQRALEDRAWRRARAVAVTSEREVAIVERRAPRSLVRTVPNGVDPDYFSPIAGLPVEPDSVVFTGLLAYRPNLDAIRHFLDVTWPLVRTSRPGATLTIVGGGQQRDLDGLRADGVLVTGRVPDVRPYLGRASCVIAPIRMGGGTRLKVVEALSMARPMVSTALGCEGIDVRDGEHLIIADAPEAFAGAVCRLLECPSLGMKLGRAGREIAAAKYSWGHGTHLLERLFEEISTERTHPAYSA